MQIKKWFSFESKTEQKEVIKMINNSRTDMEAAMSLNEKFPHLSLSRLFKTTLVMKSIKNHSYETKSSGNLSYLY